MHTIFIPLADRITVMPDKVDDVTAGGIILPETAKERPMEGVVVNVGAGKNTPEGKTIPLTVGPGDRVLFSKYAGSELNVGDQKLLVMRESDLLGILAYVVEDD